MLISNQRLRNTQVLSIQSGTPIGIVSDPIINPDNLKIIALRLAGHYPGGANILDVNSVREYSGLGLIIDSEDELVAPDDIVKISQILALNFNLIDLKVKTKKGTKLGKIIGYTLTSEDFMIQQIIVKRPTLKSLIDPELTISRKEIVEVNDYEVIVRDEEKILKSRAEKEDFIPNFVNPFREKQPDFAPSGTDSKS